MGESGIEAKLSIDDDEVLKGGRLYPLDTIKLWEKSEERFQKNDWRRVSTIAHIAGLGGIEKNNKASCSSLFPAILSYRLNVFSDIWREKIIGQYHNMAGSDCTFKTFCA